MGSRNLLGLGVVFLALVSFASLVFGQAPAVPPFPPPAGQSGVAQAPAGQSPTGQGYDGRSGEGRGRRGGPARPTPKAPTGPVVKLTTPKAKSETSIEQTLWGRRSLRSVTAGQITLEDVSQLLWAAQGITGQWGRRAAPSAGGGYPLEVILVAGDVAGLPAGVYRYYPASNELERLAEGDRRKDLVGVSNFKDVAQAPAVVVITGTESRMSGIVPAGPAAHHTVAIEAGAASQNLVLEAVALGLGTAVVSDSDEAKLVQIIHAAPDEKPFVVVVISRQ
jgi:SagB-type dehydrogenase family enzyme